MRESCVLQRVSEQCEKFCFSARMVERNISLTEPAFTRRRTTQICLNACDGWSDGVANLGCCYFSSRPSAQISNGSKKGVWKAHIPSDTEVSGR